MALYKPQFTQISNDYIDNHMPALSKEATSVFIAICRKTIGWHKETDRISYSQLLSMTNIKSVNGLKKAIAELRDNDLIKIEQTGTGRGIQTFYEINFISPDDIIKNNISSHDTKQKNNMSSRDTKTTSIVSYHDTTKESNINKNNINKDLSPTSIVTYFQNKLTDNNPDPMYSISKDVDKANRYYLSIGGFSDEKHNHLVALVDYYMTTPMWHNTQGKDGKTLSKKCMNFASFIGNLNDIIIHMKENVKQKESVKKCGKCGYEIGGLSYCPECRKKEIIEERGI